MSPAPSRRRWLLVRIAALIVVLAAGLVASAWLSQRRSQPESLAMAPDGTLIVGSASRPVLYRSSPGALLRRSFIDARGEGKGTFFFGVLADARDATLWACQLTPVADASPARMRSVVRGFDLATGAPKQRWTLPGDDTMCNDLTLGPGGALYLTDTAGGNVYRMARGARVADLLLHDKALKGVDGITFFKDALYVSNLFTGRLYRIAVDAAGVAQAPVEIMLDRPLDGPDGLRAFAGGLAVAESSAGRVSAISIEGDRAHVATLREGLRSPTAVEPAGRRVWVTERRTGRVVAVPLP